MNPFLARQMREAIYSAYRATLIGNPCQVTLKYYERTSAPVPGDLVIETSTIWRSRGTTDLDAIGILDRVVREPIPDWGEENGPAPTEKVWHIKTLDGRDFRWTNANFIAAVPLED